MFFWRNKQNVPLIITRYSPYLIHSKFCHSSSRNGSEFLDRQVLTNGINPDQTEPRHAKTCR